MIIIDHCHFFKNSIFITISHSIIKQEKLNFISSYSYLIHFIHLFESPKACKKKYMSLYFNHYVCLGGMKIYDWMLIQVVISSIKKWQSTEIGNGFYYPLNKHWIKWTTAVSKFFGLVLWFHQAYIIFNHLRCKLHSGSKWTYHKFLWCENSFALSKILRFFNFASKTETNILNRLKNGQLQLKTD